MKNANTRITKSATNEQLVEIVDKGRQAKAALAKGEQSRHRTRALRREIENGESACRMLIERNKGLVVNEVKHYTSHESGLFLEYCDAGNVGLAIAIDRFDPSHGAKFTTYAIQWIQKEIRQAVRFSHNVVHFSEETHDSVGKLKRAKEELVDKLHCMPSCEAIAQHLGWTVEFTNRVEALLQGAQSLDAPAIADDEGSAPLGELIECPCALADFEDIQDQDLDAHARRLVFERAAELNDDDLDLLVETFFDSKDKGSTGADVARQLGRSRSCISQRKSALINDLRTAWNEHNQELEF